MNNQLNTTRARIVALAKMERGSRTQKELVHENPQVGINTYSDFESGKRWPYTRSLRGIEATLGWKDGIIDEVQASGMNPALLSLDHMRGKKSLSHERLTIRDFSNVEYFEDLPRRLRQIEALVGQMDNYGIAASDSLGGVGVDQVEDH